MLNVLIVTVVFLCMFIIAVAGQITRLIRPMGGLGFRPGAATGGKAEKGVAYRSYEGDLAAVDTPINLDAWGGQVQTMTIPQGAAFITMVGIGSSIDLGAAVVSVRSHIQIRILGAGIEGGPHDLGGPAMSAQGVTEGLAIGNGNVQYNDLAIPVIGGGQIQIQAVMVGEDAGDITAEVTLGFLLA